MAHESSQEQEMGFATHIVNQMPTFESNPELFNLTTGMEMLAFPSKNRDGNNNSVMWKGFFSKQGNHQSFSSSSSKTINEHGTTYFYQTDFNKPDFSTGFSQTSTENLIVAPDSSWQDNSNRLVVDDSSFRCVFPCEGSERPSQGLSLSLSSKKPSTIGLQSFELRETSLPTHHQQQDGFFGKSENFQNHDGFLGKASYLHQNHFHLKNSKYLGPAQELLNEFCNLGIKQSSDPQKQKLLHKMNQWEDENGAGSSSKQSPLNSLDLLELQKRKVKLLSMLEEVDRRYRQYHDQMKAVVSSFEGVIGIGAASIYLALASKAMSRHFRCLRDGIMAQIKGTKKSMGEKDPVAPGTTKGETPRLRLLEQTLRQQRAFQQMSMMESHPWRPQRGLPERSVSVLRAWLFEHFLHPYPSDVDKHILSRQTGLSRSQVSNWFINARVRLWKPMVEEMYLEETKEQDNIASSDGITGIDHQDNSRPNQNNTPNRNLPHTRSEDQKPTPDQLVHSYSDSLSSIINSNPDKTGMKNVRNHQHQQLHRRQFGRVPESFGAIDLDFSSYNDQTSNTVSYSADNAHHQNFGTGVSLTLGLQQHVGTSMNLSFSPPSQHSLFYPSDHIEDCEQDEYPILNGEAQNLPYRNLMGAQLLHDLAG